MDSGKQEPLHTVFMSLVREVPHNRPCVPAGLDGTQ